MSRIGKDRTKKVKYKIDAILFKRMQLAGEFLKTEVKLKITNLGLVDTGNLRDQQDSLTYRKNEHEIRTIIGSNVEYQPYHEFGTRFMNARPHLRPTLIENEQQILRFIYGKRT